MSSKNLQGEAMEFSADIDNIPTKDDKVVLKMSTMIEGLDLAKLSRLMQTGVNTKLISKQTELIKDETK